MKRLWPAIEQPAVAISIGTGYAVTKPRKVTEALGSIFKDGFIPRMVRSVMGSRSLDGEKSYHATINGIDEKHRHRFFRLNLPMEQGEVEIDDASKVHLLSIQASNYLEQCDISSIAYALWASSFFFEVECLPEFEHGFYTCRGTIFCRRPSELARHIASQYPAASFMTDDGQALGLVSGHDDCTICHQYTKAITLEVCQLSQTSAIYLKFARGIWYPISGFPNSISWFIEQQGLGDKFGYSAALKRPSPSCQHVRPNRKRRPSSLEGQAAKRRK
jgi:hypothetical protein